MGQVDHKVVKWIGERVADLTEEGPVIRYELWHTNVDSGAEKLETVRVGELDEDENEVEAPEPEELSQLLWDVAESDADTRTPGTTQRYSIQAYRIAGGEPDSTFSFNIYARTSSSIGGNSEPATEKGALGSALRHSDNLHRLVVNMTEATSGRLAQDLMRERDLNQKFRDAQMQQFETVQDLMDRKHERDLRSLESQASAKRMDDILAMGMTLLPILMSKFGPSVSPTGADAAVGAGMKKLLMGMSEQELKGVMESLGPANQMAVMEVYQQARKSALEEDAKKPAAFQDYTKSDDEAFKVPKSEDEEFTIQ